MKPGEELIEKGIIDLIEGRETVESLLVEIGEPRLRRNGFELPEIANSGEFPEDRLYRKLSEVDSDAAHSKYNALIRRLVSFERSLECENQ